MITDLLALLLALAACVAAAVIYSWWRHENERAELRAEEAHVTENQEFYAALARVHGHSREPSGIDPRDRLPI
jgi:hypothetical protein